MSRARTALPLVAWLLACQAAGPTMTVQLLPEADLTDPNAADLIFEAKSQETNGRTLDNDGDGSRDTFILPPSCGANPPPGCGVPLAAEATVELGNLPLDFSYELVAVVRNAAGAALKGGSITFLNDGTAQTLPITLAAPTP